MAYEVKETSRRYVDPTVHMSLKTGSFTQDRRSNRVSAPRGPDRTMRRIRMSGHRGSSPMLSGRGRVIVP